jgi:hypothetical protein
MSRALLCTKHGEVKPTHPEDAARGLFTRYVRGKASIPLLCDLCAKTINTGDDCVAVTQPTTIRDWEHEYMHDFVRLT